MILTFDIGNTNIVMCCVENGERRFRFLFSSDKERTVDEYSVTMELLAQRSGIDPQSVAGAIIASVVPQLTTVISRAVESISGRRPLVVGPGVKSGLNIRMDDPTELGGDLVAAAVAAAERYPLPCVVVDMGTATAIGVLDAKGSYIGGLICPGVALSGESLARGASQLSEISLESPKHLIGKNTRDSMQSGILYGAAAMLDGIIDRIEAELGTAVSVAVTGDEAHTVVPCCRRGKDMHVDEDLVMRGLWKIYRKNREMA